MGVECSLQIDMHKELMRLEGLLLAAIMKTKITDRFPVDDLDHHPVIVTPTFRVQPGSSLDKHHDRISCNSTDYSTERAWFRIKL